MIVALATLAGGCGYTSKYSPPPDGRARAVWRDNGVVVDLVAAPTDACMGKVGRILGVDRLTLGASARSWYPSTPSDGYWVPRYWGPRIVVVGPRLAPSMPLMPRFMPSPVTIAAPSVSKGFVTTGGGGGGIGKMSLGSGGGGGGGKEMGAVLLVLAAVALAVLPAVDLGVALADPEDAKTSSKAIDQVNVYNDLARWQGSPCDPAMGMPPAPVDGMGGVQ